MPKPDPADDVKRWRALAEKMVAFGGDFEWGGAKILQKIGSTAKIRGAQRDDAIIALAALFFAEAPSTLRVATEIADALLRYEPTWCRRDRNSDSPPAAYLGLQKEYLFRIMQASDGKGLRRENLRKILSQRGDEWRRAGKAAPLQITNADDHAHGDSIEGTMGAIFTVTGKTIEAAPAAAAVPRDARPTRATLVQALATLNAEAEARIAELRATRDGLIPVEKAAIEAWRTAQNQLTAANAALDGAHAVYRMGRDKLEWELASSANPAIKAFEREMWDEIERMRKLGPDRRYFEVVTRDAKKRTVMSTNFASWQARINAIREAVEASRELFLLADQADVEARLDALRVALPNVEPAPPPNETAP